MAQEQDNNQPSKDQPQQVNQKKDSPLKNWAIFSGIGIQMALTIFLGNFAGSWLDNKYDTSYLEETLTLLAVFLSMYIIIRRVNKMNSD